jgi:hypothetical protein
MGTNKTLKTKSELLSITYDKLKQYKKFSEIKLDIISIPTNQRGENFKFIITNHSDFGLILLRDVGDDILAEILSRYSLVER